MRKKLSKLFASAAAAAGRNASISETSPAAAAAAAEDLATKKKILKDPYVAASSKSVKNSKKEKKKPLIDVSSEVLSRLKRSASKKKSSEFSAPEEDPQAEVLVQIQNILGANSSEVESAEEQCSSPRGKSDMMVSLTPKNILDSSWFANGEIFDAQQRKELSRNRKQKFLFKGTESYKFTKLMRNCATKFGPDYTLEVFGRIGRETGIKDYNALIKHCIVKARKSNGEASSVQIGKIYQLFVSMRESGFPIEEASFGPFFEYMIDMKMVEDFQVFSELIKDANPESYSRIGYYEMLLSIRVGDEDKIHELCNLSGVASHEECFNLAVSYLLAFCDTDRKDELLQLLEVVDIVSISSLKYLSSIFRSLGRLQCEKLVKKFILALKTSEDGEKNVSPLIYEYASSIPNLEVEEIISKFSKLHMGLGVCPSIVSCEMLIKLCCTSSKVRAAIEVVELICQSGLDIPDHFFDPLLHACERSCEFDMVRPIYSVMSRHNVRPKEKTFKSLISLCVRMKDFEGAYNLLADAKEIEGVPTTRMYNAIMAGYCREKNIAGALMVLKQMEHADIQPDSETYSYLIANCECQEDVFKYHNEMKLARIEKTKHVYMSFINAYAKFRNFELAKQVLLDSEIQPKYLNELKNVLVAALSSNGQITDALQLYDEIKQAGCTTEPKTVINLIEHIQSEGKLDRLLQLLEELDDSSYWFDGCSRVILYCVRYHFVNSAIGLLKKLKEKDGTSACFVIDKMYCQIWELGPTRLEVGFELLRAIKEELHLRPSRTSLDFLLSSCVNAKDSRHAQLVWSEYEDAGLSYNVLTFLRMYEALLVSGKRKKASKLLKKIENYDPHVHYIIKSCKETFMKHSST